MTPNETPDPLNDIKGLRWLRALVMVLTLTMIAAGVILIWLFITRLPDRSAAPVAFLPDTLELPAGATVQAVTRGTGWYAIVVEMDGAERIMIFGEDGSLHQEIAITP